MPKNTLSPVIRKRTEVNIQPMNAGELIRRVEVLMTDERYPPLLLHRADLKNVLVH